LSNTGTIIYSGFYDVPLAFVVRHKGSQFLFLREFDDDLDDYPDVYRVFALPNLTDDEVKQSWRDIEHKAVKAFGEVLVKDVEFDPSKRREISTKLLEGFLAG